MFLIIKFIDDTTMVGLITDDDQAAYKEEVRDLAVWCQDNNFSLNVSKTKTTEDAPIHIDGVVVGRDESFKFLDVHDNASSPSRR